MLNTRRNFLTAFAAAVALPGAIRAGLQAGRAPTRDASTPLGTRWPGDVPALAQQIDGRPLAYLDSAATTLRPRQVIQALTKYYDR